MSSVSALPASNLAAWRHAFRLRTLPLAAACILLGSGLAGLQGGGSWRIGLLAFATPILSTVLLLVTTGQPLQWNVAVAAILVVGAAFWGSR